jgi:hypothetical protein
VARFYEAANPPQQKTGIDKFSMSLHKIAKEKSTNTGKLKLGARFEEGFLLLLEVTPAGGRSGE